MIKNRGKITLLINIQLQIAQKTSNQTFIYEINFIKNQYFTKLYLDLIYFLLNKYFTKYLAFTKLHPSKRDTQTNISMLFKNQIKKRIDQRLSAIKAAVGMTKLTD